MPYAASLSLPATIHDHLRSLALKGMKPGGGEYEYRGRKRTPDAHVRHHFSPEFRVESGTKSKPFGTEFSFPAASFFVVESEKKSRCPEAT